jgi:hypothetical protein
MSRTCKNCKTIWWDQIFKINKFEYYYYLSEQRSFKMGYFQLEGLLNSQLNFDKAENRNKLHNVLVEN